MKKFKCRQYGREGTEREVEVDSPILAPDHYVSRFVKIDEGGVTFIEVLVDGVWELWRVEGFRLAGVFGMMVDRCTEAAMHAEVTAHRESLH